MNNYYISIGGTGHKVLEALVYLCAAGVGPDDLNVVFYDLDEQNRMYGRTLELLNTYVKIRDSFYRSVKNPSGLFRTKISIVSGKSVLQLDNYPTLNSILRNMDNEPEYKEILSVFYKKYELNMPLNEGFRARPYIGSTYIKAIHMKNTENCDNEYWNKFSESLPGNASANFFVAGSLFGGTGAAGFPVMKNIIQTDFKRMRFTNDRFGAFMALPYHNYPPSPTTDTKNQEFHSLDTSLFELVTTKSLDYYSTKELFNSYYIAGEKGDKECLSKDFSSGGGKQFNKPHHLELFAALAAIRFYKNANDPDGEGKSSVYMLRGQKYMNMATLPLNQDDKQRLLNFTILSFVMPEVLEAVNLCINGQYVKEMWIDKVFWFEALKNDEFFKKTIDRDVSQNENDDLIRFFQHYCIWNYSISDCKESSNHIYKIVQNIKSMCDLGETKRPKYYTYDYSINQNDDALKMNIFLSNNSMKMNFVRNKVFHHLFLWSHKSSNIAKLLNTEYASVYITMGKAALNYLWDNISAMNLSTDLDENNQEYPFYMLPLKKDANFDNIGEHTNGWIHAGKKEVLGQVSKNIELQVNHENGHNESYSKKDLEEVFPTMFTRPLALRDRVFSQELFNDNNHLVDEKTANSDYIEWKNTFFLLAFSHYYNIKVSHKVISLSCSEQGSTNSIPPIFSKLYDNFFPFDSNNAGKNFISYFKKNIHMIYVDNKPFAFMFPDVLVNRIKTDDFISVNSILKGRVLNNSENSDIVKHMIIQEASTTEEQQRKTELLTNYGQWLETISDTIGREDNANDWFTNNKQLGKFKKILTTWINDIKSSSYYDSALVTKIERKRNLGLEEKFLKDDIGLKQDHIALLNELFSKVKITKEEQSHVLNRSVKFECFWDHNEFVVSFKGENYLYSQCLTQDIGYFGKAEGVPFCYLSTQHPDVNVVLPFTDVLNNVLTTEDVTTLIKNSNNSTAYDFIKAEGKWGENNKLLEITITLSLCGVECAKTYATSKLKEIPLQKSDIVLWPDFQKIKSDQDTSSWNNYICMTQGFKKKQQGSAIIDEVEWISLDIFSKNNQTNPINTLQDVNRGYYISNEPFERIQFTYHHNGKEFNLGSIYLDYQPVKPIKAAKLLFGIDFGTSNTLIAEKESQSNNIQLVKFTHDNLHVASLKKINEEELGLFTTQLAPYVLTNEPVTQFSSLYYYKDIDEGAFYYPFLSGNILLNDMTTEYSYGSFKQENIRDDMKWDLKNLLARNSFISDLCLLLLAKAFYEGYRNGVDISYSYPRAIYKNRQLPQLNWNSFFNANKINHYFTFKDGVELRVKSPDQNDFRDESTANAIYHYYKQNLIFQDETSNVLVDIGGGSIDIAFGHARQVDNPKENENERKITQLKVFTDSFDYGANWFTDLLIEQSNGFTAFVNNTDLCNVLSGHQEEITYLGSLFKDKAATVVNSVMKKHNPTLHNNARRYGDNDVFVLRCSSYINIFFAGLMYYMGLWFSSCIPDLSFRSEDQLNVNIQLCGNGSKLFHFIKNIHQVELKTYFRLGLTYDGKFKKNNVEYNIPEEKQFKEAVSMSLVYEDYYNPINIFSFESSILGENLKDSDSKEIPFYKKVREVVPDENVISTSESTFAKFYEVVNRDIRDRLIQAELDIVSKILPSIDDIEKVTKYNKIATTDNVIYSEPVFISKLKTLLRLIQARKV